MAFTVEDLVRFQESGARIEAEFSSLRTASQAAQKDAARYAVIRNATEKQKLKIIQRLIQANTPADFDAFIDNLGAGL